MLLDAGIQVPNVKIFLQSISDAFAAQIDQYLCNPDVSLDWYNNISIRKNNLAGIAWTAVLRESETSEYTLEMIRKMYDLCAAAGQMKNDLYFILFNFSTGVGYWIKETLGIPSSFGYLR